MDTTKLLLLAGAGYLAYTFLNSSSSSTQTNTGTNAPSFSSISGTLTVGQNATLTVTVANVAGAPSFWFNGTQVNAALTGTTNIYVVTIPAALITGTTGALGVQGTNGKAAATVNIAQASTGGGGGGGGNQTTPSGAVLGHQFTTRASFLAAVKAALVDVGGSGTQGIDNWNWFLVNQVNNSFVDGGVGPDPTPIADKAGIGRMDALNASQYVDALDANGFLIYPSGLAGLTALTRGIQAVNKHPFAGRSVRKVSVN